MLENKNKKSHLGKIREPLQVLFVGELIVAASPHKALEWSYLTSIDTNIFVAPFCTIPLCLCDQENMADGCRPRPRVGGKKYSILFYLYLCLPFLSLILGRSQAMSSPLAAHTVKRWNLRPVTTGVVWKQVFWYDSSTQKHDCNHRKTLSRTLQQTSWQLPDPQKLCE